MTGIVNGSQLDPVAALLSDKMKLFSENETKFPQCT